MFVLRLWPRAVQGLASLAAMAALACSVLLPVRVHAVQASLDRVTGVVFDASGAKRSGVSVKFRNEDTGATLSVITNDQGSFTILLQTGNTYTLTAELTGFKTSIVPNVRVPVADATALEVRLAPDVLALITTLPGYRANALGYEYHTVGVPGPARGAAPARPAPDVFLSDLTPEGAPINGHGPYERDRSNGEAAAGDGIPITIGRTIYPKGLGVHPASDLTFSLEKRYEAFSAIVGLDDELLHIGCAPTHPGSVVFQVFVDGTKAYDSGVVNIWSPARVVSVDVRGKNSLRLVVTDAGDGYICDHADWADARLTPLRSTP
jgi:hypothetical protein